jgi:putative SOS response-associated peptidase YedK
VCASYESRFSITELVRAFEAAGLGLSLPGGLPNIEPVDEVRPTDRDRAVRWAASGEAVLSPMRFGFPPPGPKARPIVNFRSEGRRLANGERGGRCLVPVSGFYDFTGDRYPKTRWVFRSPDQPCLALAAVWRSGDTGDAFSLLTTEPGADVAPYHDRGVIPLARADWHGWLSGEAAETDVLKSAPAGSLIVEAAPRPPKG